MRYPVDNFKTEWNGTAGYGYGDSTSYGFHDGVDINDNKGGNSDLGKPLYAISKGKVVGIHNHTGGGNFGNHIFIQIDGEWGTRYVHYAHCLEILVQPGQEVSEGQLIAKVGNSGTVYAHCHFAIKKKTSGMDDIPNNKAELDDIWEDPIAFIENNFSSSANQAQNLAQEITDQTKIPQIDNKEVQAIRSQLMDQAKTIEDLTRQLRECQGRPVVVSETATITGNAPSTPTVVITHLQPQPSIFQPLVDFFKRLTGG